MSSNGKKVNSLQVDVIGNRNDDVDFITVEKELRGSAEFNNDDPLSYVQRKDLVDSGTGTVTASEADLIADGYGGFYLPLDTGGKEIVSIKYKITGETATYRIDTTQVSEDTVWDPDVRIGGFTNNAPQTITITLL